MIKLNTPPSLTNPPFKPKTGWALRKGTRRLHYYAEDLNNTVHSLCSLLVPMSELDDTVAAICTTESIEVCTECEKRWLELSGINSNPESMHDGETC